MRDRARRPPIGAVLAAALLAAAITADSPARELLPGPVPARVIQVIDGDTLVVKARIWLGQDVETPAGADLSAALITAGRARAYAGGARTPWCDTAELVE